MPKFASKSTANNTSDLFCCWEGTRTSLSTWWSFIKAMQQLQFCVLWIIHDSSQQRHQLLMGECVHGTHRVLPHTCQQNPAEETPGRELGHGSELSKSVQCSFSKSQLLPYSCVALKILIFGVKLATWSSSAFTAHQILVQADVHCTQYCAKKSKGRRGTELRSASMSDKTSSSNLPVCFSWASPSPVLLRQVGKLRIVDQTQGQYLLQSSPSLHGQGAVCFHTQKGPW